MPDSIASILGPVYWVFEFPTARAAMRHACDRTAQGRQAVNWTMGGRHYAAWGEKA